LFRLFFLSRPLAFSEILFLMEERWFGIHHLMLDAWHPFE
jgi:hypothetical protein